MPYADPEKRKEAKRASARRRRAREGRTVAQLVVGADLPDPPSRDLLMRALGVQALQGNVPAIRLLLEEYRRDGDSNQDSAPRSLIDELAARRRSA